MRKLSVSRFEKDYRGKDFDWEFIQSLDSKWVSFPIPHIEFEYIKKTINDYMYYINGGGTVWSKVKRKDGLYYFDDDLQEWVFDENTDESDLLYMVGNEPIYRLVE